MISRHLSIHGCRVQGVGFRWSLGAKARELGLSGWVRNRQDGSVEALIYGTPEAVEALTTWSRQGPPSARVEHVLCNDAPGTDNPEASAGFVQRPTF